MRGTSQQITFKKGALKSFGEMGVLNFLTEKTFPHPRRTNFQSIACSTFLAIVVVLGNLRKTVEDKQ